MRIAVINEISAVDKNKDIIKPEPEFVEKEMLA